MSEGQVPTTLIFLQLNETSIGLGDIVILTCLCHGFVYMSIMPVGTIIGLSTFVVLY